MYPQGGYRGSYSVYGIGDRSQTSRQPSRHSAPTSQSQSQPQPQPQPQSQPQPRQQQQQLPKPEARKEEPSKPTQPARVPSKPEPQMPKQAESKPDQQKVTATETRKESPTPVPPPPPATPILKVSTPTQSLNISASENNKNEQFSIVPADQGKAMVKASSSKPDKSLQQGIKEDITNLTRRLAELQAQHKLLNGDQRAMPGQSDLGVRVITLAGENRGATMDLGSESRNNAIYDSQRVAHKDSTTNENDENGKGSHSPSTEGPVNAYVNSNVQAANNSILYNSTCAHRDPGVHLDLSNTPFHAPKEIGPPKETRAKLKAAAKDPA